MPKVIWERKAVLAPVRNEALERIRARMQPTRWTRISDAIVNRFEAAAIRFESRRARSQKAKSISWGTAAFFALAFAAFAAGGGTDHAPYFFGVVALGAIALRLYVDWNRRNPLPPIHLRSWRNELPVVAIALIAAGFGFVGTWVLHISLEGSGPLKWFDAILNSAFLALIVYKVRSDEPKPPDPGRNLFGLLGSVASIVLLLGFVWLVAYIP